MMITFRSDRFLDAPSHLYKRVCPSVRGSVRPSVGPPVSIKEKRGLGASYFGYPALFILSHDILGKLFKLKFLFGEFRLKIPLYADEYHYDNNQLIIRFLFHDLIITLTSNTQKNYLISFYFLTKYKGSLIKQEPRGSKDTTTLSSLIVHFLLFFVFHGGTDRRTVILMSFLNCP